MDEINPICSSCGEYFGDADIEYCKKSKRKCGHHCNHIWSHDKCCWCGIEFGEITI